MSALPEIAAVIEAAETVAEDPSVESCGITCVHTIDLIRIHQALAALARRLDGTA